MQLTTSTIIFAVYQCIRITVQLAGFIVCIVYVRQVSVLIGLYNVYIGLNTFMV